MQYLGRHTTTQQVCLKQSQKVYGSVIYWIAICLCSCGTTCTWSVHITADYLTISILLLYSVQCWNSSWHVYIMHSSSYNADRAASVSSHVGISSAVQKLEQTHGKSKLYTSSYINTSHSVHTNRTYTTLPVYMPTRTLRPKYCEQKKNQNEGDKSKAKLSLIDQA